MATAVPSNWSKNLSKSTSADPALNGQAGGQIDPTTVGNPADLGGYRGMQQERGQVYDERANEAYDFGMGERDKLGTLGDQVTQQALDTSKAFAGYSADDRKFWEGTYKPAMQEQMDFARQYTTPERAASNRAGAMSGVSMAFDANADMAKRNLSSFGIDPSSGRYAGLDAGLAAKRAAAGAAAGTKSDRDTEALGQEYLDRAIRTGAALPGQSANEAGVSLAGGNAAANTGIAIGDAQKRATEPSGWVGAGDAALKEWKQSLLEQTSLGMQQNRDTQAAYEAEKKSKEGGSSGIGALIGAGAGIVGSIYGGPMGGMIGSKLGSMAGGAMSGGGGGGGGGMFGMKRGGPVRYRAGGPVTPQVPEDDDDDMATTEPVYRPGQDDRPEMQREYQLEPKERTREEQRDWPNTDTDEEGGTYQGEGRYEGEPEQPDAPPPRYQWGPNYAQGGNVDHIPDYIRPYQEFADGGEVMDEEEMLDNPDEEMAEPQGPPSTGPLVPPEASPSGGQQTDDVHALLNEGEFVMPKDVVRWLGEKFMQRLIQKAHDEMAQPQEAEPEMGPPQAMAIAPPSPSFQTAGA